MWMLPLYLHVNQKSVYDDDDDKYKFRRAILYGDRSCFEIFRVSSATNFAWQVNIPK